MAAKPAELNPTVLKAVAAVETALGVTFGERYSRTAKADLGDGTVLKIQLRPAKEAE